MYLFSCYWEAAIQECSQKIIVFRSSHQDVFTILLFWTSGQIFEKYFWWSAIFSKFACNFFLLFTTGAEELVSSNYFAEQLFLWNTFRKLLLCSQKREKILGKHSQQLDKFQVPVCGKLVQDVWFFKETKKQKGKFLFDVLQSRK